MTDNSLRHDEPGGRSFFAIANDHVPVFVRIGVGDEKDEAPEIVFGVHPDEDGGDDMTQQE